MGETAGPAVVSQRLEKRASINPISDCSLLCLTIAFSPPRTCPLEFIAEKRKRRGNVKLVGNSLSVTAGASNASVRRGQMRNPRERGGPTGACCPAGHHLSFLRWTVAFGMTGPG